MSEQLAVRKLGELHPVDDVRIRELKELIQPLQLIGEFPVSEAAATLIFETRQAIHNILYGEDPRLLLIVGPCSIHDPVAAVDYAGRLQELASRYQSQLLISMRVYFEKPRTTVGWKGLINDPYIDESFQINDGLRLARKLLHEIHALGMTASTEYLDMITPQFIADFISWAAIGARTTESQVHRELASGLSCPIGFKNGTDGNVKIAVDAVQTARHPHSFLSVTKEGHTAIVSTRGNEDGHIILRGGKSPNYDNSSVQNAANELARIGLPPRVMIDCSHANSSKDYRRQRIVAEDIARQLAAGERGIFGVMVESNLCEGRQDWDISKTMSYGVSITDSCIGWEETERVVELLAEAVESAR